MTLDLSDPLTVAVCAALACAAVLAFLLVRELVAEWRRRRFLKLLDERLSDRADGARLTAPGDFKVLHGRKDY